ncbi:MAG: NADH:flavin oxidoreductase [Anaerolineae bacterium]|nr:NADH:flavin oxidoreductase [Anaerolineae bacterium]
MAKVYKRVARLGTAEQFGTYIAELGIDLPFDNVLAAGEESPMAQSYQLASGRVIGNRWSILPMEGWDGTPDGLPTERTLRRWRNFGRSGGKLIWGCEATAVRPDGRANPNQLMINSSTLGGLEQLRSKLLEEHRDRHGSTSDLLVGLQLTHSGRFARPEGGLEPKILYHNPLLSEIFHTDPGLQPMTDGEIEDLIGDFVRAAAYAQELGFDFVDVKHCHGYLGHEFLSAYTRPGPYGGSFENRTRFLREIVSGIRSECPGLAIGVRLSAFDFPPFREDESGQAVPLEYRDEQGRYPFAFGSDPDDPTAIKMDEILAFVDLLRDLEIQLVNLSAGSPYYNPHIVRPAYFPPSDGYAPPEDPLVGVARQIQVVARIKSHAPDMALVGSGYTYLQDWLPNVAQHVVRTGMTDFVGLGRMVLSYPELPADVLQGKPLARKKICRTFSDCTTAPRHGMISGCYPLDEYYRNLPEAEKLKQIKSKD